MRDSDIKEKYNGNNTGFSNRWAIVQVQTQLCTNCINNNNNFIGLYYNHWNSLHKIYCRTPDYKWVAITVVVF